MTNEEIEKMFNGRFIINLTTYDKYTFEPIFKFIDSKYNKSYSIAYQWRPGGCKSSIDYDKFKINTLQSIVDSIVEVRDEKINIILDEG
jgi:hypothetical protein